MFKAFSNYLAPILLHEFFIFNAHWIALTENRYFVSQSAASGPKLNNKSMMLRFG